MKSEADRQYVLESSRCLTDWAEAIETDPGLAPSSYWTAIAEQAELIAQIASGKRRSPWSLMDEAGVPR